MSEIRAGEVAAPGSYHPSDEVKFPRFLLHPARPGYVERSQGSQQVALREKCTCR